MMMRRVLWIAVGAMFLLVHVMAIRRIDDMRKDTDVGRATTVTLGE